MMPRLPIGRRERGGTPGRSAVTMASSGASDIPIDPSPTTFRRPASGARDVRHRGRWLRHEQRLDLAGRGASKREDVEDPLAVVRRGVNRRPSNAFGSMLGVEAHRSAMTRRLPDDLWKLQEIASDPLPGPQPRRPLRVGDRRYSVAAGSDHERFSPRHRPHAIEEALRMAGVDPARPIVTTCGSGVTAAILHFDLDPAAMPHPIFLNSGRDRPLWRRRGEQLRKPPDPVVRDPLAQVDDVGRWTDTAEPGDLFQIATPTARPSDVHVDVDHPAVDPPASERDAHLRADVDSADEALRDGVPEHPLDPAHLYHHADDRAAGPGRRVALHHGFEIEKASVRRHRTQCFTGR